VDARTGADVWKHARKTTAAGESQEAYTTPCAVEAGGKKMILVVGADFVTAHDAGSGAELWRSDSYNSKGNKGYRTVATAVLAGAQIVAGAPRGGDLFAVKLDGKAAWTVKGGAADVVSPTFYDGRLYVLDGAKKTLTVLKPESGDVIARCPLGTKSILDASPTAADGRLYCMSQAGEVVVVSAGDQPKVLHTASFGPSKKARSSIAIAGGKLFIRTDDTLYCVGK
jgi:outer membrane protein assembly factor BamB